MILGIDASAISAGCALYEGGKIVAEQFLNTRHTHSETLLPMVKVMLGSAKITLAEVDKIAVTTGPGSFTGLRIGISCVKGMCFGSGKPCVSVSTLEAIAYNFVQIDGIICACMDARCRQVYNALFRSENGVITRLCADRAISAAALSEELSALGERVILAGDGAELMHSFTEGKHELAPIALRFQRGSGVCLAAENKPEIAAAALMPSYLRLPQAERERLAKSHG
ncbi:MAG: tRNA (adenosine(37)-N6)-threonylcarbamoyltransferase complex dimerization subunit type 1 TsaB [Lachnospiraceae bacterium]|nr:tRNA (adenosine(37)-N6)-threonylcarbamoyltransferase complex dimerization subunit type 1 TsaB [Ruminococcus sp.]MCM1275298.1 tRNA (adenosine(37)-N6)-threonylcarbamoyltransferase complex dimerization subunit type 1 TsaB [Lachnospiraceae bacterium]